jgi:hypothetical protein
MTYPLEDDKAKPPRVLLHSQRNFFRNYHYRTNLHEFENIVRNIDSVEMLAPQPENRFKYGIRIADRLASSFDMTINPGIPKTRVRKYYDLFFVVAQFPKDLLTIKQVEGWKDHCKASVCWLSEIWNIDVFRCRSYLRLISDFDYVILNLSQSVNRVQEVIRGKCMYLPQGIDAILFCPYPDEPPRVIDVYSIGRRSKETHQALLNMLEKKEIFYVFDTLAGDEVIDPDEHRIQYANMAKRSRYFIVNPGKINSAEETGGQSEIGNRYFEGAAAGTILIGERPKNEEFKKMFHWPDAVIDLPFGSDKISSIIKELDAQPSRQAQARRSGLVASLLEHDWAFRWEAILKAVGLAPSTKLLERKKKLRELAYTVDNTIQP